jgi:hypothetical protein
VIAREEFCRGLVKKQDFPVDLGSFLEPTNLLSRKALLANN